MKGQLAVDIALWKDNVGETARLISTDEIIKITNGSSTWDPTMSGINFFYLDTNSIASSSTCTVGNTTGCNYGWLYDRTSTSCTTYGCLKNGVSTTAHGYWTSTKHGNASGYAFYMYYRGSLGCQSSVSYDGYGVRPVITVSKTKVKPYTEPSILKITTNLINEHETVEYYDGTLIKGNIINNYVWYSGFLWRIMGKDNSGNIKLIMEENITAIPYHSSSTTFNESYIHDWLNNYFYQRLKNANIIVNSTWCSDVTTVSSSARTTCTNSGIANVILPTIDEYNLVGGTNSYLKNNQYFWTSTPQSNTEEWYVSSSGSVGINGVTLTNSVRPVIKVSSNVTLTRGNGTLDDAYILGETKPTNMTGQITNVATSGEYVSLAGKTYRVVDKEADGVKLILDGYYTSTTKFRSTSTNVFETTIDTNGIGYKLNNEVLTWLGIVDNPNVITTTWNQGIGVNYGFKATYYLTSSGNSVIAKVGLIKMGEMLSGQSQSITTKKSYWTLTPYSNTYTWIVSNYGSSYNDSVTFESGVRPVIKVNSNTNITGGNGTLSNPYKIG